MKFSFLYKLSLLLFLLFLFFYCPNVNAESVSGYWTLYHSITMNSAMPVTYNSLTSGVSFPSNSFVQLTGANYTLGAYDVISRIDLQPTLNYVSGNSYTFHYDFEFGSYIYPYWPTSSDNGWKIWNCPGSNCQFSYTWVGDPNHQGTNSLSLTYSFKANNNTSSNSTFILGKSDYSKGLFYNAYSSQQGIRISGVSVDILDDPTIDAITDSSTNIINNQNQNTQTIINNQNENTQQQIESQQVCNIIDMNDIVTSGFFTSNGSISSNASFGITDYIDIFSSTIKVLTPYNTNNIYSCFYDDDKSLISCVPNSSFIADTFYIYPTNARYFRATINFTTSGSVNRPRFSICKNGNQALADALTDPSIDSTASNDFFNGISFYDNYHFSSIITSPINYLNSLDDECSPVVLSLFGKNVSLPCGTTVFWDRTTEFPQISTFRAFWNVLFGGLIIYRLTLELIMHINNALDPTKDEIGGLEI